MLPDKYYESEFHDCKDLGNGGFGIVRRARHAIFKDVALKVINTGITKHARDEIANMIKVRHPNIVEFYGILLSSKDIPIGYVMNFMADGSIHDVVHGEKCYQTKQAYTWIMNSAAGLAYLHMKKIVHRDVKPMNILLDNNKKVARICDLGISRDVSKMTTNPIGTHRYMSPEALNDPRGLSYSTDVWSLGVTVWEIHRRRLPPLPNLNGSFHLEWSPRSDIETGTMLKRMLTPIPKDRPSMEEIVEFALAKSETCGNGSIRSPIEKSLQNLSLGSSSSSASSSLEGRRKATIGSWLRTTASLSQKSANRPDVLKLTKQVEEVTGKMKNLNRLKKRSSIEKCLVAVQNMMSNWLEAVRKALLLYPELADCEQEGREVLDTFEKDAQMRLNIGAKESD